jgi:hypothetical protein
MITSERTITLSRTELYHRVWTQPIVRVAEEFGISDVALAKLCRRRNVPRPPRGYWARIAAGYTPAPPPLPDPLPQHDWPVVFRSRAEPPPPPEAPSPSVRLAANPSTTALHPIAERLRKSLLLSKPSSCGRVRVEQDGVPLVIASPRLATNAALLVHTLIEEAQRKQIDVSVSTLAAKPLEFRRGPHTLHIYIEEELRPPPPEQVGRAPKPSGQLTVRVVLPWKQVPDTPTDSIFESVLARIAELLR